MDVRCPECDTLYEIDTRQLRGSASTLKCSQCEHIFHMQTHAALTQENQRRWMLRSHASGDIRYFIGFDELHRWILQGVVSKQDDISRTGKKWQTLGAIGEFMPIFQALDSISSINDARQKQRSAELPAAAPELPPPNVQPPAPTAPKPHANAPAKPERARMGTSRQFSLPPTQKPAPSNAAHRPNRTRTPISSKARNAAPSGQQTPPQPRPKTRPYGAPSAAPTSRQPTSPPAGEAAAPDDGWSFGELPLGMAEGREFDGRGRELSGPHARTSDTEPSGQFPSGPYPSEQYPSGQYPNANTAPSRSKIPILVATLLVLGAGLALYQVYPPFLEDILGPKTAPEKAGAPITDLSDETPPASQPADQEASPSATKQAQQEALAAQQQQFLAAIEAARPTVNAALTDGLKDAQKAVPEEPKELSVNALLSRAKRSLDAGRSEQARKQYHKILSRDRRNSSAITGLGWSLIALNRPPAAAAQFKKAIALNPSYGDAYIGLGRARRDMGDHQGALDAYQSYLDKFPSGSKASIARHQADKLRAALGQ